MAKTVDSSFLVPISLSEIEYLVKRSRFIAFAAHTKGTESAKSFLHELQVRFPDARHHCYGFIAGSPNNRVQ
jgi:putative IMPACT (imprinted ancient) family translation regulator